MEEEIQRLQIEKNGSQKTTHENLWDAFETMIRGKLIAVNTFTNKMKDWK